MLMENAEAEVRWRPRVPCTVEELRSLGYTEDCQVCGVPTQPIQRQVCYSCWHDDTRRPYGAIHG